MINKAVAGLVVASLLSLGGACNPAAPELPPADSITMDVSVFNRSAKVLGTNFIAARDRVGLLNAAIVIALAPPAFVFALAVSKRPTWDDGKWIWDFTTLNGGNTFVAHLTAWFDGNSETGTFLNLEMKVTCTACAVPTEEYVWYTGRFNTAGTDGGWQFFNPEIAVTDQSFIDIDYDVTDATHKSLTFTNVRTDGHADAGDVIEYSRDGDDAHVSVHDEDAGEDYVVEWSASGGAGWIQVPGYNGGARACWDDGLANVTCPAGSN